MSDEEIMDKLSTHKYVHITTQCYFPEMPHKPVCLLYLKKKKGCYKTCHLSAFCCLQEP